MNRCSECWLPSEGELCRDCLKGEQTAHWQVAHDLAHISRAYAQREGARDTGARDIPDPDARDIEGSRHQRYRASKPRTDADRAADRDRKRRQRDA